MATGGRPVTKKGKAAAKHRRASREEYQKLPVAKKEQRVKNRSTAAQRKADAKRLEKSREKRNAYHKADSRKLAGKPKAAKCARCGSTKNLERHTSSGKVTTLCSRCHSQVKG